MPLSRYLAEKGNALEFNLCVFEGKDDWSDEVRERLIEESIQVLDDLTLDPVLSFFTTGCLRDCTGTRRFDQEGSCRRRGPK